MKPEIIKYVLRTKICGLCACLGCCISCNAKVGATVRLFQKYGRLLEAALRTNGGGPFFCGGAF